MALPARYIKADDAVADKDFLGLGGSLSEWDIDDAFNEGNWLVWESVVPTEGAFSIITDQVGSNPNFTPALVNGVRIPTIQLRYLSLERPCSQGDPASLRALRTAGLPGKVACQRSQVFQRSHSGGDLLELSGNEAEALLDHLARAA